MILGIYLRHGASWPILMAYLIHGSCMAYLTWIMHGISNMDHAWHIQFPKRICSVVCLDWSNWQFDLLPGVLWWKAWANSPNAPPIILGTNWSCGSARLVIFRTEKSMEYYYEDVAINALKIIQILCVFFLLSIETVEVDFMVKKYF